MKRSTQFLAAMLAGIGIWLSGPAVRGGIIPMPPAGPVRIAKADAVIVGKVESLEPQDVKIGNATYRIAVVKINQGLKGSKDAKTLRIGFLPLPKPPEDGKGPRVITTGARPVQLQVGQEGLFILNKQAKEEFYTIGGVFGYFISSDKNNDFDKEVEVAKSAVKALANPLAGLKSKDADERLLAAAILIEQYRAYRGPDSKLEPIDAAESKLILQALADGNWQANADFRSLRPNPAQLFRRLGISATDGFKVAAGADYPTAAQAWLRQHAQKYRIQRIFAGDAK